MTRPAPVTVLVPVYKGVAEVRECLASVVRHGASEPFELLVIDDASPETEVRRFLDAFAVDDDAVTFRLLRNEQNLGFPGTVNRGLDHASGDVVILNADTVVTSGWLDRLRDAASAEADVATVTPLSNFGSICTVPSTLIAAFGLDGPEPRIDDCGAFVATHGLGRHPEVISGVGFCMYVTRTAIDMCGTLDAETFGVGYGEEVDFCIRATRLGFRHLVEDQTFVYHHGGVSFGDEREEGLERGSALIRHRYPFFRPSNRRERAANPLAATFASLDLGLQERQPDRPHVLHILHSAPDALGGTEKHLASLLSALLPDCDFSILHPVTSGFVLRTLWLGADGATIEHEFLLPGAPRWVARVEDANAGAALQIALDMYDFDAVHVQNLINHSLAALDVLADFPGRVVCSVRDLYFACPSHWLLYHGHGCGIPDDLSYCATCLPETRALPLEYLEEFRATVTQHIDTIDTWVFATQSAADYLLRVYDIDPERIDVIEHGALIELSSRRTDVEDQLIFDEPLRVAFVGLGRAKKGLEMVAWLADSLRDSDIEIHHFGELGELTSGHIHLHGAYDNHVLPELLENAGIHIVLLPGAYAETFGHVMTEALVAGRPVIGASYGALGERIRATGAGWTVDPVDDQQVLQLLTDLAECRDELRRATQAAVDAPIRSIAGTAPLYLELYQPGGSR